jgi:hypothetical protein
MFLKIAEDSVCGVASQVAVSEHCRSLHTKYVANYAGRPISLAQ